MFFRSVIFISIIMVTISCDFISPEKTTLNQTDFLGGEIDFNQVDVYPLFKDCKNCNSNEEQNICFETGLVRRLEDLTKDQVLESNGEVNDTVYVDILVNAKGEISIAKIQKEANLISQLPELDSLLYKSFASLPKVIQPSLKRGIPVNSMFKLPVLVSEKK